MHWSFSFTMEVSFCKTYWTTMATLIIHQSTTKLANDCWFPNIPWNQYHYWTTMVTLNIHLRCSRFALGSVFTDIIALSRGHISNHHQLLHMHQAQVTSFYVFFVKYSLHLGGSVLKTFSTPTWNIPSFLEVLSWRLFLGECWCSKLPPLNLLPINCPN